MIFLSHIAPGETLSTENIPETLNQLAKGIPGFNKDGAKDPNQAEITKDETKSSIKEAQGVSTPKHSSLFGFLDIFKTHQDAVATERPVYNWDAKLDLVEFFGLNVSNQDGTYTHLSPLLSEGLTSINDSRKLNREMVDRSPKYNPYKSPVYEPDSVSPLIRPKGYTPNNDNPGNKEGDELSQSLKSGKKVKAALVALVRNEELAGIISSMTQLEKTFNSKFHYDWIFFNDKPFTSQFKQETKAATKSKCQYIQISSSEWDEPSWIDKAKADKLSHEMEEKHNIQYAGLTSYHKMCRYYSGPFFTSKALQNYDYYWRVEPNVNFYCSIDYDVFAYMQDNDKDYGFVLNLYDSPHTIQTLWPTTIDFFQKHPQYLHPNSARQWLLQSSRKDHNDYTGGYSTCHFWSNFEIGRLDFFRSKQYQEYFKYLDEAGGFFYERWGDAPVHSLALALMTDKSRIHWFRDIGYNHIGYTNCHASKKCSKCVPGRFTHWRELNTENCMPEWFKVAGDG